MKNLLIIFSMAVCLLVSACSNPDDEAKKLGFSNSTEMKELQEKGFKTAEEYKKSEQEKSKIIEDAKSIRDFVINCYSPIRMQADLEIEANTNNSKSLKSFEMAYRGVLSDADDKLGMDNKKDLQVIEINFQNYRSKLISIEQSDAVKIHKNKSDECLAALTANNKINDTVVWRSANLTEKDFNRSMAE